MEFKPVRLSRFQSEQPSDFDLYIALSSKYLLYLRKGDCLTADRLARLKSKNLKKLFIRAEDDAAFRAVIEQAYDMTSGMAMQKRALILHSLQQTNIEEVFENPEDPAIYEAAKKDAHRFSEFLLDGQAMQHILSIKNTDQDLIHHCVTVASLAVAIAKLEGSAEIKNLQVISLGGMLHDLGHAISGAFTGRAREEMSGEESKVYLEHAHVGAQRIKDLIHIDSQIAQLILQHEENIDGSGFPGKLTENKMNPLAVFIQSANIYDRLVSFERKSPAETIKLLMTTHIGRYPLAHLNALKELTRDLL